MKKHFIFIDTSNIIIGNGTAKVLPENAIEVAEKPVLQRGILYKYENGAVIEDGLDYTYLGISNKNKRENKVSAIKVTTATGKVFDGDEKSQERMLRSINIASITGDTTTQWKMADNTVVDVTLEELKEALALAGKEMSRIWLE